jgi:hypothetical protein
MCDYTISDGMAKQVDKAITDYMEAVFKLLGRAVGHTVIGFVFAMLDSPWLRALLQGGFAEM